MEEGEILSSGQIFHSKTKHFVSIHHAGQEEGGWDQNGVKQRQKSQAIPSFCCISVSHLISCLKGPVEPLIANHTNTSMHTSYTHAHTCTALVDVLSAAEVDEQKAPLRGCSVMRGGLIVNMLLYRVFHLTAGQKGQAIKFGSSEASTL